LGNVLTQLLIEIKDKTNDQGIKNALKIPIYQILAGEPTMGDCPIIDME